MSDAAPMAIRRDAFATRRARALEMRNDGKSYAAIGREFGVSGTRAKQIINTAERKKTGPVEPWSDYGFMVRYAMKKMNCRTAADVQRLGETAFKSLRFPLMYGGEGRLAKSTLKTIERIAGGWPETGQSVKNAKPEAMVAALEARGYLAIAPLRNAA